MEKVQIINDASGQPGYAVVPYQDWLAIQEAMQDADDGKQAEKLLKVFEDSGSDGIPLDVVKKLAEPNAKPIKIIREWRGIKTQQELADMISTERSFVAAIENKTRAAGIKTRKAIAAALRVDLALLFED